MAQHQTDDIKLGNRVGGQLSWFNIRQKTDREQWGEMAQLVQHQTEDRQGTVGRDGSVGSTSDRRQTGNSGARWLSWFNIRQKTDREQWGEMAQLVQHQTEDRQGTVGRDGSVGSTSDRRQTGNSGARWLSWFNIRQKTDREQWGEMAQLVQHQTEDRQGTVGRGGSVGSTSDRRQTGNSGARWLSWFNIRQKTDREQWDEMAQLVQHQTEDRQGTVGRDGSVGTASDIRWVNRVEG